MTATYPARTVQRYRGAIYGLNVIDHDTGIEVPNDYRGKTRQRGRLRENQHRDRQPFSDRIVGDANVLWEGVCTDEELAEMERRFIQDAEVRPRLNVEINEDNPHRIPKWKQVEQRHERDRRANRPLWQPYEQRSRRSLLEWDTPDRPAFDRASPVRQRTAVERWLRKHWRRWRKRWLKRLVGWGSTWLGSTLATWLSVLHWHLGRFDWQQAGITGACVLPAVLLVLQMFLLTRTKRTRQRAWRTIRRWGR